MEQEVNSPLSQEEIQKILEARLPFNRIIRPKQGEILAWLSRSEGQTFLTYLSELRNDYVEQLILGRSKNGQDVSDLYRGMIKMLDQIMILPQILAELNKVKKGA